MLSITRAQLVVDSRCAHGEGPVWDEFNHCLLWVNLTGGILHRFDPVNGRHSSRCFNESLCAIAPRSPDLVLAAFAKRIAHITAQTDEVICQVEPDLPGNRCNDGKCDPAGRFWIGTMSEGGRVQGAGSLYRLDGVTLTRVLDGLTATNGMDWSTDSRTMFLIDTCERAVWAFDFDPADSSIRNRRTVVRVPESLGLPDGMCVAPDDTLWVAHWGTGCVCRWDPRSGGLLQRVETGCPHTSSCNFAPDGTLYITTSRLGLTERQLAESPNSGGLFRVALR